MPDLGSAIDFGTITDPATVLSQEHGWGGKLKDLLVSLGAENQSTPAGQVRALNELTAPPVAEQPSMPSEAVEAPVTASKPEDIGEAILESNKPRALPQGLTEEMT